VPPPPPPELEPFLVDFDPDKARLWLLDLEIEDFPVERLRWHLTLPWWTGDAGPFTVRPANVLAHPRRYPDHYARTLNADLRYPLHVVLNNRRWTIIDGVHRLLKAVMLELDRVPVRRVPRRALATIRRAA
jgi:hypothetical protein